MKKIVNLEVVKTRGWEKIVNLEVVKTRGWEKIVNLEVVTTPRWKKIVNLEVVTTRIWKKIVKVVNFVVVEGLENLLKQILLEVKIYFQFCFVLVSTIKRWWFIKGFLLRLAKISRLGALTLQNAIGWWLWKLMKSFWDGPLIKVLFRWWGDKKILGEWLEGFWITWSEKIT